MQYVPLLIQTDRLRTDMGSLRHAVIESERIVYEAPEETWVSYGRGDVNRAPDLTVEEASYVDQVYRALKALLPGDCGGPRYHVTRILFNIVADRYGCYSQIRRDHSTNKDTPAYAPMHINDQYVLRAVPHYTKPGPYDDV